MVKKTLGKIVLFLLAMGLCFGACYIGSLYSTPAIPAWYDHLEKPGFAPPSWILPPVWMVLSILSGLSLYLLLQNGIKNKDVFMGLLFFLAQLAFGVAWSYVFFGLHSTFFGLMTIIALWFLILCTMLQVFRVTVAGGAILIPYFLWVTVLLVLSYFIMTMNPVTYVLF